MDTRVHGRIAQVCWEAMPADFRAFCDLPPERVAELAKVPDEVWHDNLVHYGGAESSSGWWHSNKLSRDAQGRLRHVAGAVRTPLSAASWLLVIARRGGFSVEPRELFPILSHYCVDALTLPHLTRELSGEQHTQFEQQIAHRIAPVLDGLELRPLALPKARDVGGSLPILCRETYLRQVKPVREGLEAGTFAADLPLMREIVGRCAGFVLVAWSEWFWELQHLSTASRAAYVAH